MSEKRLNILGASYALPRQSPGAKLAGAGALLSADRLYRARRPTGACGNFVSVADFYSRRPIMSAHDVIDTAAYDVTTHQDQPTFIITAGESI